MHFTQQQMYEILEQVVREKDGFTMLVQMCLEILMKGERSLFKETHPEDYSNGYRIRNTYGQGKLMELRVPRTRSGNFYPLLLGILRNQEEEALQSAFRLYIAGLTTEQVGEIYGDFYGGHYSTSQVSGMFETARSEVRQ